jgi:hypothetical protein
LAPVRYLRADVDVPADARSVNPELRRVAAVETDRALRDVLGYRLYLDLRRGWRITSPNLEQTGLLRIDYLALDDAAADADLPAFSGPVLAGVTAEVRVDLTRTLLDFLRRGLAIKVRIV